MKRRFIDQNFRADRLQTIATANEIIESYQAQGYRLTLRQLYYQFVSRDLIRNSERSYKALGNAISDGRLAGLIDWAAIEDRVRVPKTPGEWDNIEDLVESAVAAYRLDRWDGQASYCELWVEKDALAGVLEPVATDYHVTLMVNRGYSSQSAMYVAANRFRQAKHARKAKYLFYLGDHDPSGEDMVRDVRDRLALFGAEVEVTKIALTMAQVEQYGPPPNPAKMTDSRAEKYVAEHGDSSWEVDALPPEVLVSLIRTAIDEILEHELMDEVIEREDADKAALERAAKRINKNSK